jgi:hypothetical protein
LWLNTANGLLASYTVKTKEIWPHIAAQKKIPLQGHMPHRKQLLQVQGDVKAKKRKEMSVQKHRHFESHHRLGHLPLLTTTTFYCCSCCIRIHKSLSSISVPATSPALGSLSTALVAEREVSAEERQALPLQSRQPMT